MTHFKTLTLSETHNPLLLRVDGPAKDIEALKKYLTITNTSIRWQQKQAIQKLAVFNKKLSESTGVDTKSEYKFRKLIQHYENQIVSLDGEDKEELFYEDETGVYIPSGFHYLAPNNGDFALNKKIKPYLLDGLRDYQKQAVESALKYKRSTVQSATGTGKSIILTSLALSAVKSGYRACIIVPSEYLVGQMEQTLKKFHDSVAAASGKRHAKLGCDILVVTAQSAKKFVQSYQVVAIDEAHHVPASTWRDIVQASKEAIGFYSLSATPFRSDGLDLVIAALGGPVVFTYSVKDAIDAGWLTKPEFFCVKINPNKRISPTANSIVAYKALIQSATVFSYLFKTLQKALSSNRKPIVVFKTVKAGEEFRKFCAAGGIQFEVATGEYKKPLYAFSKGETNLLVACDKLISEGIDIPCADTIFIVTQNSSDVTTMQMIGRVLRKAEGKEKATIIDIVADGYPQFAGSFKKRLNCYKSINENIKFINF